MNKLLLFLLSIFPSLILGQNIIPNSSFEDINICQKFSEKCSPKAWRSTSFKAFRYGEYLGDQSKGFFSNNAPLIPKQGTHYISLRMYNPKRAYDRSFAQVAFLCPMEQGKKYKLTMYVLSTLFQINSFGVYFTDSLLIHEDTNFAKNIIPDLHFEKKGKWKPLAWNKLEITFTASKTKHGLILGNFAPDESIKSTPIVSKKQLKSRGYHSSAVYYYFDEIYLEALDSIVPCDKKKNKAFLYQDSSRHMSYQLKTILDIPKPVIIEKTKTIPKDTLVKILNNKITKPKIIEKIELNKVFVLENILFKTNSDELLNSSFPSLDELGKIISKNPKFSLSITGHTDNVGSFQYNQVLSQKRAIAVSNYLNQKWAIDFSKLKTSGKGEELPIATNNTESGRKINRRVEFKINH